MKTKLLVPLLFIAGLFASTVTASAQIRHVFARNLNHNAESLVLGLTAYSSGTFVQALCDWTSPTAPATLSASGTMSGGPNDGYTFPSGGSELASYNLTANMSNGSARCIVRGKNNNGGTASSLQATVQSSNAVNVVIWGPTLNGFGLTGAANSFTWSITGTGYSNSGTGEASFTVPSSATSGFLTIVITPTGNDNELGHVMVNFNN
jgi:hypothetical protein